MTYWAGLSLMIAGGAVHEPVASVFMIFAGLALAWADAK